MVAGVLAVMAPTAESAASLKLRVGSLSAPSDSVAAGGTFETRYKVTRRGSGLREATLRFYVSPTKSKSSESVRLATRGSLSGLKRKRSLKSRATLRLPASVRPGSYFLLACVENVKGPGASKKAACRPADGKLAVAAAPSVARPPGIASPMPAPGAGAGEPSPGPGPDARPVPASDPARPLDTANPRSVTPALDAGRAVTRTIGPAGGTLTATAANGTKFTLSVPSDALAGETRIQMTPLASIAGLPFDGLVGAVDLTPEGLRFYEPVTLAVQPSGPLAAARQSPFVYNGAGNDFRNYPLSRDDAKLELTLMHFTGAGLADGSSAQRDAQQAMAPANIEGQFEQRSAKLVDDARQGRPWDQATWEALNREYYEKVVAPRLTAAETNDELAELAITTFLGWLRSLELVGSSESFAAEIAAGEDSLGKIIKNAYEKAFERCVGGELGQVQRMLGIARAAALLGFDFGDDLEDRVDRCVRFSLDYDLDAEERSPYSGGGWLRKGDLKIRTAAAPLRFNLADGGTVEGPVPLTVTYWDYYDYVCAQSGGTATVARPGFASLAIQPGNPIEERRPDGSVRTTFPPPTILGLRFDPGELTTLNACGLGGFSGTWYRDAWNRPFEHLRETGAATFMITPWTFSGGDPWATFADARTAQLTPTWTFSGDVRFRLRHTPQGAP